MNEHDSDNITNESEIRRFGGIGKIDYQQDYLTRKKLELDVGDLYRSSLNNINIPTEIRELIKTFPAETKKLLAVIVEANNELTKLLGVGKPTISLRGQIMVGRDRRMAVIESLPGGNAKLSLDSTLLEIYLINLRNGRPLQEGANARKELRRIIAHEYHHLKLKKEFPIAYEDTVRANQPGQSGEYLVDRGEKAADLFGDSYAHYKSQMETYPDRVLN